MAKKKSTAPGEKTKKSIDLARFQRELDELNKKKDEEGYKPKFGRQMKAIRKKMKKLA